jgi:hypothetical protein
MPVFGRLLIGLFLTAFAGTALAWTCRTRVMGQMDHETLRGSLIAHVAVMETVTVTGSEPYLGSKAVRLRVVTPVVSTSREEEFLLTDFAPWDRSPGQFEVGSEWVLQMGEVSENTYPFWPKFQGAGRLVTSSYCAGIYSVRDGRVEGPLWGSAPRRLTMPLREFIAAYSRAPQVVVP